MQNLKTTSINALHLLPSNLVIYDGMCRLCSWSVKFLLSIDKKKVLKFTTLIPESNHNQQIGKNKNPEITTSILFIENNRLYSESEAILRIFKQIGGMWKLTLIFRLVPSGVRNYFYRLVARNRYKVFGFIKSCEIPDKETVDRFLPGLPASALSGIETTHHQYSDKGKRLVFK